ncbi:MAG: hypothetical protein V4793_29705 [Paraburkholderia tropica]|uniref:hypothetical protein n=1 Tax=Paraburkholderia TaxID=1822464 RepID=UPI001981EFAA|nr:MULTISPECIES: hypothetical protein [Paraburkholderia]MBN3811875.1 hypothetical protein [Paraburkholderia sp. Ac-20347]
MGVRLDKLKISNQIIADTFRANELVYQSLEAQTSQKRVAGDEHAEAVINENNARYRRLRGASTRMRAVPFSAAFRTSMTRMRWRWRPRMDNSAGTTAPALA